MTHLYEVGPRRMGVRWSEPGLAAALARTVAADLGVAPAPATLSIVVGERTGRTRAKHQLHALGRLFLTTASDGRLCRAVLRTVASLLQPLTERTLSVRARVVVGPDGHAVLVDNRIAGGLVADERRLVRLGFRIVDAPFAAVDDASAEVVLSDPIAALGVDTSALERSWPLTSGGDDLTGGCVPIRTVVHWDGASDPCVAARSADLTAMVVDSQGTVATEDVRRLLRLVDGVGTTPVRSFDRATIEQAIAVR